VTAKPQQGGGRADEEPVPEDAGAGGGSKALEGLARRLLTVLGRVTGLESTYLTMIHWIEDQQEILFASNTGKLEIPEGLRVIWSDTLCRRALDGEASYTDDVPTTFPDSEAARALGLRTYLTVPIRGVDGSTWGTLCGASSEQVLVDEDARLVMELLSEMVAGQLERDLARQRLAEANSRLEQANVDLARFAATASHDLRAPLRRISAFSSLLVEDYGDSLDENAREYLGYLEENTRHLDRLVGALLDLSKVTDQPLRFEPVDLDALVVRVRGLLGTAIEESGAAVVAEGLGTVPADPCLLERLVQNLVGNALAYQPRGQVPEVVLTTTRTGDEIVLRVADNGIGIPPGEREIVFEAFRRLVGDDTPGTGLGLAVCRRIVERHDGRIWVEDNDRGGTTFAVALSAASG
jgi:signal transduction histidine kinase